MLRFSFLRFFYGGIPLNLILSLWSPDSTMPMHSTHTLQHAVPTLYGRDQSPGVPWGIDGHGAVFYRVRVCPRVLGWILHTGRYVDSFCLMRYRRVVRLRRPSPFPTHSILPPKHTPRYDDPAR